MSWNAMNYDAKENLLRTVRQQADDMFALAEEPGAWERQTACTEWQVRDIIGHLVDTTEAYFVSFDAARGSGTAPDPLGVRVFQDVADAGAKTYRSATKEELMQRVRSDFAKMMELCEALGPDDWGGLIVTHKFMGPLPALFYPVFQLMDYGVHSWDIRQGTGRGHGLDADTADLLAPFMLILWQATADPPADTEPYTIGVRFSGRNGGDYRIKVARDGLTYEPGSVDDLPGVIEFDAGSLVLTAFGRVNGGTIHGDRAIAERFLNTFFRI